MRTSRVIDIVNCHAAGEVGDVIVGGVAPPPGDSIWAQSRWIHEDGTLRQFVLNEPRGGVFRHVNLLVPPRHPDADAAFIIMEPADTPPMSGSNTICVATVLLETGRLAMIEPVTRLVLEAPGGLVEVVAQCRDGRVEAVRLVNHASFADRLNVALDVPGIGRLNVHTAYGGDSFFIVDAAEAGLALRPEEARHIAELGMRITAAANDAIGFRHRANVAWDHISFCLFATPVVGARTRHAVAIRPGKIDRSPTGTGVSARLAVLHALGEAAEGYSITAESILGSTFEGKIERTTELGGAAAIIPSISGSAWIYGKSQLFLDPADPWPTGYRLSDTWPRIEP